MWCMSKAKLTQQPKQTIRQRRQRASVCLLLQLIYLRTSASIAITPYHLLGAPNGKRVNLAMVSALHLFLWTSLLCRQRYSVSPSSDKCTHYKSLWIKASAKCPKCKCVVPTAGRRRDPFTQASCSEGISRRRTLQTGLRSATVIPHCGGELKWQMFPLHWNNEVFIFSCLLL